MQIHLEKRLKVAIYNGSIPGPLFIENLIKSVSEYDIDIYLFGKKSVKKNYSQKNIFTFNTPNNKVLRILFIFYQGLSLVIKTPSRLFVLIQYYRTLSFSDSGGLINWWSRVLPVINNLPDIFHIQWAKALPFWFFLKKDFGVKIILSLRGAHINYSPIDNNELAKNYKRLFPKVDSFHAVSNNIAKEAQKYGLIKQKTKIILSGVDLKDINCHIKKDWAIESSCRFISVGRHHWIKGYQYALSALEKMINNGIPAQYTIIANNQPSEEILYNINDLNLNDYVFLKCVKTQSNIFQIMSESDCMLLPSVEEGIANVVLEAMAIGLPVISSDCAGMKEVVVHENNGLLYNKWDNDDLLKVMMQFFHYNNNQRKYIADNAMSYIQNNHSINKLGKGMSNLYFSLK